jgi:hypothetical protein
MHAAFGYGNDEQFGFLTEYGFSTSRPSTRSFFNRRNRESDINEYASRYVHGMDASYVGFAPSVRPLSDKTQRSPRLIVNAFGKIRALRGKIVVVCGNLAVNMGKHRSIDRRHPGNLVEAPIFVAAQADTTVQGVGKCR